MSVRILLLVLFAGLLDASHAPPSKTTHKPTPAPTPKPKPTPAPTPPPITFIRYLVDLNTYPLATCLDGIYLATHNISVDSMIFMFLVLFDSFTVEFRLAGCVLYPPTASIGSGVQLHSTHTKPLSGLLLPSVRPPNSASSSKAVRGVYRIMTVIHALRAA